MHGLCRGHAELEHEHRRRKAIHDDGGDFVGKSVELWAVGDVHGHGIAGDFGNADGKRDVRRRDKYAGNRYAQWRGGDVHRFSTGGRRPFDHGRVRRGHELYGQHFANPDPDGDQGRDDHGGDFVTESVELRPVGDVHGDGVAGNFGNSDGNRDFQKWHDDAGNRNAQRRNRDIQHFDAGDWFPFDHGNLRRRHELYWKHFAHFDADCEQGRDNYLSDNLIAESVDVRTIGDANGEGDVYVAGHTDGDGNIQSGKDDGGSESTGQGRGRVGNDNNTGGNSICNGSVRWERDVCGEHFADTDADGE